MVKYAFHFALCMVLDIWCFPRSVTILIEEGLATPLGLLPHVDGPCAWIQCRQHESPLSEEYDGTDTCRDGNPYSWGEYADVSTLY